MKKNEFNPVDNTPFNNENYTPEATGVALTNDDNNNFIVDLTCREETFCSMQAETKEEKAALFKAMNNPEKRLGDCINMKIKMKDLYCEVVKCTNKDSGEVTLCPRIVIIDDKGVGYQAVSLGVYSAIKKVIQVFGAPTWVEPIEILVKQVTKDTNKLLTFDIV